MNKYIVALLVVFALFSCKKESSTSESIDNTIISVEKDSIKNQKLTIVSSSKFIEDWAEIITFEEELKRVLNATIQTEKDVTLLKELLSSIKKTTPERFKTLIIESRVKVLETEIAMLEQDLKDSFLTDIANKKMRTQKAYNVFVGQIEALILKEKDYEKYN